MKFDSQGRLLTPSGQPVNPLEPASIGFGSAFDEPDSPDEDEAEEPYK
jgi:hypothetical protein